MPKIRSRLESYVVRNTADIVDDLTDERRSELAEVLHELEGHSPRADEAERRAEELVAKLENRNVVIAKARARIDELEREVERLTSEAGDRESRIADQIETERIRVAEREQIFRSELESREREIANRLETLELREHTMNDADRKLAKREHVASIQESTLDSKADELERRRVQVAELEAQLERRKPAQGWL
jgi:chromosome segregation ATPase